MPAAARVLTGRVALAAFALVLAAAAAVWPRTASLDIGGPTEGSGLRHFSRPATYAGRSVRWLDTSAVVRLEHAGPYPLTVSITLAAHPEFAPATVEVTANGQRIGRAAASPHLATHTFRVDHGIAGAPLVVGLAVTAPAPRSASSHVPAGRLATEARTATRLAPGASPAGPPATDARSSTSVMSDANSAGRPATEADTATRLAPAQTSVARVALDRLDVHTGGLGSVSWHTWRLFGWLLALIGAAMALAGGSVRLIAPGGPAATGRADWHAGLAAAWAPASAGVLVGVGLVWARFHVLHHVPWLAVAAACAAVVVALAAHPRAAARLDRYAARLAAPWPNPWPFVALAAALLFALLGADLLAGRVWLPADVLFEFEPWNAYRPDWYSRPGNPLLGDVPEVFHPFLVFARQAIERGDWPLWSPAIFGGHPLFASFQSALLSPFTAIALVLPLPAGTVLRAGAILLTGGLGMFLFVRRLELGGASCYLAGLAYLLNPFSVVWLGHPLAPVAAWLPWLLWAAEGVVARARRRDAALLALFTALCLLAGHPETSAKVLLVSGLYLLVRLRTAGTPGRALALATVGFAAGVLATAVQLAPFAEYLAASRAYLGRQDVQVNPLFAPLETLITAVVPSFLGRPEWGTYLPTANRFGLVANYCEQQTYAGVVTLILASVGLVAWRRDPRVRFFALSVLLAWPLMYGAPGLVDVVTRIPLFGVAALSRLGLVVITAAIVLAAFGLQAALAFGNEAAASSDRPPPPTAPLWPAWAAVAAMTLCVGLFLAWLRPILASSGVLPATLKYSAFALAQAAIAAGVLWLLRRGRVPAALAVAAWLAMLSADLLLAGRGFHPSLPPEDAFPVVAEIEAVRRDPDLFRVAGFGDALVPNTAMAYGLQDIRGYDGMWPDRYTRLLHRVFPMTRPWPSIPPGQGHALLDLLNVKYVFGPPGLDLPADRFAAVQAGRSGLYRNRTAFPRAFLAGATLVRPDADALETVALGRVDLRRTVVLTRDLAPADQPAPGTGPGAGAGPAPDAARPGNGSDNPSDRGTAGGPTGHAGPGEPAVPGEPAGPDESLDPDSVAGHPGAPGEATVTRYEASRVEVSVRAERRAWLVLSDRFAPGWRATVDGRNTTLYEADYALRAVIVPTGTHRVVFHYEPWSWRLGVALSATSLPVLALGLVLVGPNRRRARGGSE